MLIEQVFPSNICWCRWKHDVPRLWQYHYKYTATACSGCERSKTDRSRQSPKELASPGDAAAQPSKFPTLVRARAGLPQGVAAGGMELRLPPVLWQSPPLGHVRGSRPLPRSVSRGWQGRGKAIQKDIFLLLHIFCMLKYLWPRHTWHIKKYYTLEECWKKVIWQCSVHFEKQMLLIQ